MKTFNKIIAITLTAAALTFTFVTATAETADSGTRVRRREKLTVEERIRINESLEDALRRYERKIENSGVKAEQRKREHYEKPSVKRKKKSMAARKTKQADPERRRREAQIR